MMRCCGFWSGQCSADDVLMPVLKLTHPGEKRPDRSAGSPPQDLSRVHPSCRENPASGDERR